MRLEDLSRELERQADDASGWAVPTLADLRVARGRQRRRRAGATAAVVALVAATATLGGVMGRDAGRTPSREPHVLASPTASPTLAWRPERCARAADCAVPDVLVHDGRRYQGVFGGRQPVHGPNGINRSLFLGLDTPGERDHLVLAGATGTGAGGRLELRIGDRIIPLVSGRLTLLRVPDQATGATVSEHGRPGPRERLLLEEYVPLR
jgi:hypothetical protein